MTKFRDKNRQNNIDTKIVKPSKTIVSKFQRAIEDKNKKTKWFPMNTTNVSY